jgi:SAM-dependent methyltransferase
MQCNVCGAVTSDGSGEVEEARVRSNVRKFAHETFAVWRCPSCLSIHARDEVDLAHYYADYPFHKLSETTVDWMLQAMYGNLLSRLRKAGVTESSRVLDYGCGSGLFLSYLRARGFTDAQGYDEYSERFADKSVLAEPFDCVMAQDVIEHVPDPQAFVRLAHGLTKPGSVIALGTPNAEAIDLQRPEKRVHTLHQPYHRHILTMYANTRVPGVNSAFVNHYFSCHDDTCDLAVEPIKLSSWKLYTPVTLAHFLFGSFWAPECDVMVVFRRGA